MSKHNLVWKCLYLNNDDLLSLARHALELHAFLDFATRQGLGWGEYPDRHFRDFAVGVPTDRLEAFVQALRTEQIGFGTVDCCTEAALEICQRLGVEAELEPAEGGD